MAVGPPRFVRRLVRPAYRRTSDRIGADPSRVPAPVGPPRVPTDGGRADGGRSVPVRSAVGPAGVPTDDGGPDGSRSASGRAPVGPAGVPAEGRREDRGRSASIGQVAVSVRAERMAIISQMGTRERPADRGRRRTRDAARRLAADFRQARIGAGLSLRDAAAATGASHPQLIRFERGELERFTLAEVGAWCAVVGLDLSLRAYPAGDPIRDRAQLALLERLRCRLHPSVRWRTEVPLPLEGDLRAWDGVASGSALRRWKVRVEAETKVADGQAMTRRLQLKIRDDPGGHVLLLVADSRANRQAMMTIREGLRDLLPLDTRQILLALGTGRSPVGSGVAIL